MQGQGGGGGGGGEYVYLLTDLNRRVVPETACKLNTAHSKGKMRMYSYPTSQHTGTHTHHGHVYPHATLASTQHTGTHTSHGHECIPIPHQQAHNTRAPTHHTGTYIHTQCTSTLRVCANTQAYSGSASR